MKKIATLVISLLLVVSALLCSYIPTDYSAGEGDGKNEKIRTIEKLSTAIKDTCALMSSRNETSGGAESSTYSDKSVKYESVTLVADTSGEYTVSIDDEHYYYFIEAEIKVYIDSKGKVIYSIKDAFFKMDYVSQSGTTHIFCKYDADLYFYEDVCAVKYYSVSWNGATQKQILGKWINVDSISGELTDMFDISISSLKNSLLLVDKYITNYKNEAFDKKNDKYTMNDEYLQEFILDQFEFSSENAFGNVYEYIGSESMSMEIDLSDSYSPTITTKSKNAKYTASVYMNEYDTVPTEAECQYSVNESIRLENINNTKIDFDESKIVDMDSLFFG